MSALGGVRQSVLARRHTGPLLEGAVEGAGFQQIKDELRRDAAIEYLLHTPLPLLDIANRVGFSEASTFHRAFKQWTGVAPGEYRLTHAPER